MTKAGPNENTPIGSWATKTNNNGVINDMSYTKSLNSNVQVASSTATSSKSSKHSDNLELASKIFKNSKNAAVANKA